MEREIYVLYHFVLLLFQNAEAVARLSNLFLSKVSVWRIATLLKTVTTAQVFSVTFPNVKEQLFYRTSANGRF